MFCAHAQPSGMDLTCIKIDVYTQHSGSSVCPLHRVEQRDRNIAYIRTRKQIELISIRESLSGLKYGVGERKLWWTFFEHAINIYRCTRERSLFL